MTARERNPERSRERILDAALKEFAAHGYAGARVGAIAERAGLNKQLISHHFGGKRGLYDSVMRERRIQGGGELDARGVRRARDAGPRSSTGRATIRSGSASCCGRRSTSPTTSDGVAALAERSQRYAERTAWVEREQAAGRLPADLDPPLLLLSLLGAARLPAAPARRVRAHDRRHGPRTTAFADRYRAHLAALARHLAARRPDRLTRRDQLGSGSAGSSAGSSTRWRSSSTSWRKRQEAGFQRRLAGST